MKHKLNIFTQAIKWDFEQSFKVSHSTYHQSSDESRMVVDLNEQEIEINVPDDLPTDFTNVEIAELEKLKLAIQAKAHRKVKSIDEKIQSLLAIENKVEK